MEAAVVAAIGEFFGSAFNWFAQISGNNAINREIELTEAEKQTLYFDGIFGYKTAVTLTEAQKIQQGTTAITVLFIVLIFALIISNRK